MNPLALNAPAATVPLACLFESRLLQHRRLFAQIDALREAVCAAAVMMAESLRDGGQLLFYGDGCSASDAQQLAAEFNSRFCATRPALPALALSAERATRAALAEAGADQFFARLPLAQNALPGGQAPRSQDLADLALPVPHAQRARVHEADLFIGHTWCRPDRVCAGLASMSLSPQPRV